MIKANFKISGTRKYDLNKEQIPEANVEKKDLTQDEFEELIIRSGASGSFMVFRSDKKEDELGIDEL